MNPILPVFLFSKVREQCICDIDAAKQIRIQLILPLWLTERCQSSAALKA
jgi:hypothetical protein